MKIASGIKHKIMKIHFLKLFYTRYFIAGLLWSISILFTHCQSGNDRSVKTESISQDVLSGNVRFAKGFDIEDKNDFKLLHLFRYYNDVADTLSFVLAGKELEIPDELKGLQVVRVPVNNIALLHSSYLAFFNFCQAIEPIKAISEVKYVYDQEIFDSVQNGLIKEIGYGETLDKEQLLSLDIDLIVTVGWPNSPDKSEQFLNEIGIPKIVFSEWQESTLLGRAEWVKVIAALTGEEEVVNARFDEIAATYDSLVNLTHSVEDQPQIICNLPYKGSWFVPGGNSYVSNMIDDAGGQYLWRDDTGTGGLQLDFESVYAKGLNADFWINPGIANRLQDITDKDPRLVDFKSIQSGKVYNSNNRVSRDQANDYWESAIVNPHIVLSDVIHILHSDLLPNYQLVYFRKIEG